jgi:hypothetical protein
MDVDADGLPISCAFCLSIALSRAYDQANNADSTIAALEPTSARRSPSASIRTPWLLAPAHKRLGELYEARGDTKKAAEHYAAFVELWKRADPDLQPKVAEAPDATGAGASHAAAINKRGFRKAARHAIGAADAMRAACTQCMKTLQTFGWTHDVARANLLPRADRWREVRRRALRDTRPETRARCYRGSGGRPTAMLHAFSFMMLAQLAVTPTMIVSRAEHDPVRHHDRRAEVLRRRARSRSRWTSAHRRRRIDSPFVCR